MIQHRYGPASEPAASNCRARQQPRDRRGGSSSRPASTHVDDYQRAAARAPPAAAAAGRKAEKLNVQQLLADPTSMQVIASASICCCFEYAAPLPIAPAASNGPQRCSHTYAKCGPSFALSLSCCVMRVAVKAVTRVVSVRAGMCCLTGSEGTLPFRWRLRGWIAISNWS